MELSTIFLFLGLMIPARAYDCASSSFNTLSGSLSSPNYPNHYPSDADCDYLISVPKPHTIKITFNHIDMETCCDFLRIYDGTNSNATLLTSLSGKNDAGVQVQSSDNNLYIKFITDSSVIGTGFQASYVSHCRITTLVNALSGSLSSPGYPNQYPNNANCDYQITVPAPYTINLLLRNINMESCCDYLRVYDGTSTNASLVAAFNGNSAAGTQIQSTGNNLYITFQTDSSVTGLGFLADYRSACTQTIRTSLSGSIYSPGYGSNYLNNEKCGYFITVPGRRYIRLTIQSFDLEQNFDYLRVYALRDGSLVSLNNFTGPVTSGTQIDSPGNNLVLAFTTDGSVTRSGFYANYQALLFPSGSGSTFGTNTDRLTKVETAAEGDWPWQSAVYRNGVFVCGGTLIASRWVLTAAHCVGAFGRIDSNGSLAVIVGDLHREFNEAKEQRYDVEQVTIHPDYSSSTKQNDIALLRLENAAALSDKTKTATIPNRNATAKEGSSCYVTGWGSTDGLQSSHAMLQEAGVLVRNTSLCRTNGDGMVGLLVTEQMMCFQKIGFLENSCISDAGGPIVCQDSEGHYILNGVVSQETGHCLEPETRIVSSKVTEFVDWINDSINNF